MQNKLNLSARKRVNKLKMSKAVKCLMRTGCSNARVLTSSHIKSHWCMLNVRSKALELNSSLIIVIGPSLNAQKLKSWVQVKARKATSSNLSLYQAQTTSIFKSYLCYSVRIPKYTFMPTHALRQVPGLLLESNQFLTTYLIMALTFSYTLGYSLQKRLICPKNPWAQAKINNLRPSLHQMVQ